MNTNKEFVTASEVNKEYSISASTLRNWAEKGYIRFIRLSEKGKRLYSRVDIINKLGLVDKQTEDKLNIIYARVSSLKQSEDLERQIEYLKSLYPSYTVIKDVASGVNWKRPGLCKLLEYAFAGKVGEVVISYKDRLCRFGFELFQDWIFAKNHIKLVVCNKDEAKCNEEQELAEDLLSIVNVFVAKNNGRKAAKNRQLNKGKEIKSVSDKETEIIVE